MSYHVYTTKGIVLSQRPFKEADRVYSILTRDLGLIRASAIGVRKEASKLRGSLEPVSLTVISLVRGKEFWRLTSADGAQKIKASGDLLRPLTLLEQLVQGESSHAELYDAVEEFILKEEKGEEFEIKFVARILFELGYLKREDLDLGGKALLSAINDGLKHSHLA